LKARALHHESGDLTNELPGVRRCDYNLHMPEPAAGELEVLFLGTGTSAGVPMIGCHCPVCSSTDPRDHRDRPSVCISYGQARVIVDTTPELRLQCIRHSIDMIDAVVYTHAHADHMMGLDDIRRFNALKAGPLDVYADERTFAALNRCFGYAFREPEPELKVFRPHLIHRDIKGPFEIGGITWTPIPLLHGAMPILGFRVGHLAYCTDVSEIPESSYDLLNDLDVLVLDALQHKKHTTHFSLEEACAAAERIGARQTLFTHIAHAMPHAATNATLPAHLQLAYDGQRVTARM
jgi:phosphoribosyl 1,2-cyclic phosphate phosphodiesterase